MLIVNHARLNMFSRDPVALDACDRGTKFPFFGVRDDFRINYAIIWWY
jgi:hypothetical protein